jgi:hypothetical protein
LHRKTTDLSPADARIRDVLLAALVASVALGHTVYAGPGRTEDVFRMDRPYGVILLFRVTVPLGANVRVDGRIPRVAGVSLDTTAQQSPAFLCHRRGLRNVCVQREEWCPMPDATWHFRVVKTGGPAGQIRVDFVVGAPPS